MTKKEISNLLTQKHQDLYAWLKKHPLDKWEMGPSNKWTTGQHILHLIQSEKPLNLALKLPRLVLKYRFGKCNRPQRNYDQIVEKYNEKLKSIPKNAVSPFSNNMIVPTELQKQQFIDKLETEHQKMQKLFDKWKDKDLDSYIVPHPLLGKMTLREIVMWTAYHTECHLNTLNEKY